MSVELYVAGTYVTGSSVNQKKVSPALNNQSPWLFIGSAYLGNQCKQLSVVIRTQDSNKSLIADAVLFEKVD